MNNDKRELIISLGYQIQKTRNEIEASENKGKELKKKLVDIELALDELLKKS